jgi:hypothetical protein
MFRNFVFPLSGTNRIGGYRSVELQWGVVYKWSNGLWPVLVYAQSAHGDHSEVWSGLWLYQHTNPCLVYLAARKQPEICGGASSTKWCAQSGRRSPSPLTSSFSTTTLPLALNTWVTHCPTSLYSLHNSFHAVAHEPHSTRKFSGCPVEKCWVTALSLFYEVRCTWCLWPPQSPTKF